MASGETNGDTPSALDEFKPPPGVVLPPRDIRTVLEKTAGYVARNGVAFEDRIRERESQKSKFSFLDPSDAYYPFYAWRVAEIRAGRGTDVAAGRAGEPLKLVEEEKPKGPPKPPDFQFSARMPRINQKDLDVIRLTALFVAKNGRQFMTQLAQRETGNPQFQFLIPNHTFHNFFQHIIDQYTTLLRAGGISGEGGKQQQEAVDALDQDVKDKLRILTRARERADYTKFQELERQKKEEEEEQKKADFARIDWSDFVVVETINFSDNDEQANLPPPTNLAELQYASLEDRNKASIASNMRIEEAMPGEEDSSLPAAQVPAYPLPAHPGPPTQAASYASQQQSAQSYYSAQSNYSAQEEEEQRRIQERSDAQARMQQAQAEAKGGIPAMKIREDYVPQVSSKLHTTKSTMAICPNCGQYVRYTELQEHLRIELLDPRWKEQKAKADARYSTSNISHADVANNLKRFASQRSDVFDPVTGQALSEEETARRKKASIHSFDGNPDGATQMRPGQMPNVDVNEQIQRIYSKYGEKK